MKQWVNENPMTALMFVVFIIVAVVGGVVVLTDNGGSNGFTFEEYTNRLTQFALAVGILGAGKAVKKGLLKDPRAEDGIPPADTTVGSTSSSNVQSGPVKAAPLGTTGTFE